MGLHAGSVPATGHRGHVLGQVFAADDFESSAGKQLLVYRPGRENVDSDGASGRNLGVGDETGDDRRIGEENPRAGCGDAAPLSEDVRAVREVTHHIYGDDGVKALIVERQASSSIDADKTGTIAERALFGESGSCGDALLEEVDPHDARPRGLRKAESGATRPAAHVEQVRSGAEAEPLRKTLELVGRNPTGLPEVVSVCRATDMVASGEARVRGCVQRDMLTHALTLVLLASAIESEGMEAVGIDSGKECYQLP